MVICSNIIANLLHTIYLLNFELINEFKKKKDQCNIPFLLHIIWNSISKIYNLEWPCSCTYSEYITGTILCGKPFWINLQECNVSYWKLYTITVDNRDRFPLTGLAFKVKHRINGLIKYMWNENRLSLLLTLWPDNNKF